MMEGKVKMEVEGKKDSMMEEGKRKSKVEEGEEWGRRGVEIKRE